jgi:hypothetical protein
MPESEFPRRRKPSEIPAAAAERKRRSRERARQMSLPETADVTPPVTPPVTPSIAEQEQSHSDSTAEHRQPASSHTPDAADAAADAPESKDAIRLLTRVGIAPHVAADLVLKHGPLACRAQLEYLPHRSVTNRPAALVRAIAKAWEQPPAWLAAQTSHQAGSATTRARQEAAAAAERHAALAEERACALDAALAALPAPDREAVHALALGRLSPAARDLHRAGKLNNPIPRAELAAAEWTFLREHNARAP